MTEYQYITLRNKPKWMVPAAEWFHSKWRVPVDSYLECMEAYLRGETEYGWYLCLDGVVEELRIKGISPVYLITDHIGFYERYGWEFLCMVQGDNETNMTRMYIHR